MARQRNAAASANEAKKPTATRIYRVMDTHEGKPVALVEATSAAQALSIVTADLYTVDVPTALETAKLLNEDDIPLRTRAVATAAAAQS